MPRAGAVGRAGGGLLADRVGKARLIIRAMAASGACCLLAGPFSGAAPAATVALCLVWGVAVVANSAQFSASVAEHSPRGLSGTMLTVQTYLGFALTLPSIHLVPWLAERAGWGWAFASLAVRPALGCAAMACMVPSGTPARSTGRGSTCDAPRLSPGGAASRASSDVAFRRGLPGGSRAGRAAVVLRSLRRGRAERRRRPTWRPWTAPSP